jgi:nicotinate phosphoribosyltransferase
LSAASGFQRAQAGDHVIPRLHGLGNGGGFVLARQRNGGTELPAHRTDHPVDGFVAPIRGAAGAATHIGFGAAGATPFPRRLGRVHESSVQVAHPAPLTCVKRPAVAGPSLRPMDLVSTPLLTDLYQLTMLQAYYEQEMTDTAVFELFVRKLPPGRRFLVAAGLEQALDFLEGARFGAEELDWIERSKLFRPGFAARLGRWRFGGDVHAMPEGTLFFPDEPILRVSAPMPEAQLVETRLLNLVHLETVLASKAAHIRLAVPGKGLIDFGLRRAHGAEAGLLAARAAWIAGFDGSATALAAPRFGIPVFGTMAHSFVQAHDSEAQAFAHFAAAFPDNAVLLVDTYDTPQGVRRAAATPGKLKGVRLDSGDLDALSRQARRILDDAGHRDAIIFASGNLDEERVAALVAAGAPIDSFGVGTSLSTSADAPYLDAVYKLEEYAGRPRRKRSTGKATWPGRKQVWRQLDGAGRFSRDVITAEGDRQPGEPLLAPAMAGGRRLARPGLAEARARCAADLARLPAPAVEISPALRRLADEVDRRT